MQKSRVSQKIFNPQYQVGRKENILVRSGYQVGAEDVRLDGGEC